MRRKGPGTAFMEGAQAGSAGEGQVVAAPRTGPVPCQAACVGYVLCPSQSSRRTESSCAHLTDCSSLGRLWAWPGLPSVPGVMLWADRLAELNQRETVAGAGAVVRWG